MKLPERPATIESIRLGPGGSGANRGDQPRPGPSGAPSKEGPSAVTLRSIGATFAAAVTSVILALVAWQGGAGETSRVSRAALIGWAVGCVVALVSFARFRVSDGADRLSVNYVVPTWKPPTVAIMSALVGWIAGSVCAFLVAESISRW